MEAAANVGNPKIKSPTKILCLVLSKLLLVALPVAQICIGATYLKECPQQDFIPLSVLVCGVSGLVLVLSTSLHCSHKNNSSMKRLCYIWHISLSGFSVCWFIACSTWIYSIYIPNYNSDVEGEPYCNKTLYQFAFWSTVLVYILFAMTVVGGCCLFMYMCLYKPKVQPEEDSPD